MIWRGRWEGGSGLGTHVHPWLIHVKVWQNQYSIVKQNKVKIKIKKKEKLNVKKILEYKVSHFFPIVFFFNLFIFGYAGSFATWAFL